LFFDQWNGISEAAISVKTRRSTARKSDCGNF
jgi:hypothetical protein